MPLRQCGQITQTRYRRRMLVLELLRPTSLEQTSEPKWVHLRMVTNLRFDISRTITLMEQDRFECNPSFIGSDYINLPGCFRFDDRNVDPSQKPDYCDVLGD
jgi:hypothetical protein